MKYIIRIILAGLVISNLAGCRRDNNCPPPPPPPAKSYVLKMVDYKTYNYSGTYNYNPDGTLAFIDLLSSVGQALKVSYTQENGLVKKVVEQGSLYETVYEYNAAKQVRTISYRQAGQTERASLFEFIYQTDGLIAELIYSEVNIAGKQLKYHNIYYHDASRHLSKVISLSANAKFEYIIDAYSGQVSFNPWTFINQGLHEMYPIYNFAVLRNLTKLPAKITVIKTIGSADPVVDKVYEYDFTITDQRLDKSVGTIKYTDNPQMNHTSEVLFFY